MSPGALYRVTEISDGRKCDVFFTSSLLTPVRKLESKRNGQGVYNSLKGREHSLLQSRPLTLLGSISSLLALK